MEDDKAIRSLITTTLETQGYGFHVADTGQKAILEAVSYQPDIIILDLGLPDMDGVEFITKVRSWSNNPIIVVSARSEDKDKIKALDAGADDYLTKPFSIDELLARIRVAFRKMNYDNSSAKEEPIFVNGGLKIDYSANTVYVDEEEVHLTPMEYRLLCLLAKNVGKVLTHNYILDKIWVNVLVDRDTQSLRVFMATLRKKIEKDPSEPKYIQTHIGVGYRLMRIADSSENE